MKLQKSQGKRNANLGTFSVLLKLNRYLRSILQRIHQAVVVVDGNSIYHSVPELFVKLDAVVNDSPVDCQSREVTEAKFSTENLARP